MAPTERSIPPARMIRVMPIDRHRLTEIWRRMFQPLSGVKNLSDNRLSARTISASAISDWNRTRSSRRLLSMMAPTFSAMPRA